MTHRPRQGGTVVIIALILLTALVVLTTAFLVFFGRGRRALTLTDDRERGLALAEAGVEKAVWELSRPGAQYRGETRTRFGEGFFTVTAARQAAASETWAVQASGFLIDEIDSPPRRLSSVPAVTARVEIDRFPDGRPRRVRMIDWRTHPQPPTRPKLRE